jgi:fatty-acyl-CoA synthase
MRGRRQIPGIGYWVEKAARMHPERLALVTREGRFSYADLAERVNRTAAALGHCGVGRGDRFGILLLNDVRFLELVFAAGRIGAVAVPLNWRLTASELVHPLADAGLRVLFVGPEQAELGAKLGSGWDGRLVQIPEEYDELCGAWHGGAEEPVGLVELPGDDDPVLMVYTSGTTGKAKGAVLTHANLFWNAINDILALGLDYRDTALTALPLTHSGGIGLFTLPILLAGGKLVLQRSFDAETTLRLIEEHRVTAFLGVPTVHRMLVESRALAAAPQC